jgi:acyl-homoserine-lactone acylase
MRAVSILATASLIVLAATQARAQSPVTIDWDEWGVAHVQAADLESGAYGLGWSQMEARGGTVAMAYLVSRGEASACLGESWAASDTRIREMGVPARSEAWVTAQEPETKSMFAGFVRGMNAWLDRHPQSEGPMACLGQVRDSDPLAFLQVSLHVAVVAFNADSLVEDWKESRGSNAYAVAPQRTADGRTLLLINPHSGWSAPFLTYETHLITPDLNIYGQTFPGLPLPFAGFTGDHGWAFTFNDIDGVDLYDLTLADGGYRFGNDVLPFDRRTDRIQVRLASGELESRPVEAPSKPPWPSNRSPSRTRSMRMPMVRSSMSSTGCHRFVIMATARSGPGSSTGRTRRCSPMAICRLTPCPRSPIRREGSSRMPTTAPRARPGPG